METRTRALRSGHVRTGLEVQQQAAVLGAHFHLGHRILALAVATVVREREGSWVVREIWGMISLKRFQILSCLYSVRSELPNCEFYIKYNFEKPLQIDILVLS